MANVWAADKPWTHMEVEHAQGSGTHQPVPSQYRGDRPWVKGKRGYGLAVGRRRELILGFPLKLFWEKCPAGDNEKECPPLSKW